MHILHIDSNHPLLLEQLNALGHQNTIAYTRSKTDILKEIHQYQGIVIRSRFSVDANFIDKATNLRFIARVGAGLENIDCAYAKEKGIALISAPEGNRNAVAEHTLGMLLSLFNNLKAADKQIAQGKWLREENRGIELDGQTVGIIGYGNMGKAFAKKLRGFDLEVLCYDCKANVADANAKQVSLKELQQRATVVSLHTPQTPQTLGMINKAFIDAFAHPFWFINTARGKSVVTKDLVAALKSKKIRGAGLDVLEYEKSSFEDLFKDNTLAQEFIYLTQMDNVILSPHVAGWSVESNEKLAQTIVDKIKQQF